MIIINKIIIIINVFVWRHKVVTFLEALDKRIPIFAMMYMTDV